MSYNKKDIKFIRFGDLSPIKQSGYKKDTYHSAPVNKGFYAFVEFMIEPFLLGGYNPIGTKYSKRKYIKDHNGNKVIVGKFHEDINKPPVDEWDDHFEWIINLEEEEMENIYKKYSKHKVLFYGTEIHKNGYIYLHTMKKPKRFSYKGEIWHHHIEETPNHLILKRSKDWVLTDFNTFVDSFNKAVFEMVKDNNVWRRKADLNLISTRNKQYSKDIFEVFIEKI